MRSADVTQGAMFSYRTLEERIPRVHPLRKLRALVDGILVTLHAEFEALYADCGRPSIPPERLLRASLIQTLHTIRSERQLVQHIEYNLLYRWFVGLDMDDPVWDHSSFAKNRERLLNEKARVDSIDQCDTICFNPIFGGGVWRRWVGLGFLQRKSESSGIDGSRVSH